jgi:CRP-like cAMP-binding protein
LKHHFPAQFVSRFHEAMNQLHPVPAETLNAFLNQFELIDLKKGEVLLREGEVCKHLYFILKGGIRCFMNDENGKEINLHFYFEDQLASEFKSLRFQIPSDRNLVTLTASKVLRAARPDYIELFANNIDFTQAAFRFFQEMFLQEEEHSEMLRKLSADERYQYVMAQHPHLLQKVSLTQLASWLGISRESVSRIRARF